MRCDCRRRAQIIKVYINTLTLICLILFGLCSHYFKQIRRSAVLNCRIKTEFLSGVQRGMCRPHVILLTKKGPAGSVISFGIQNMTKWKETKHTFKKKIFFQDQNIWNLLKASMLQSPIYWLPKSAWKMKLFLCVCRNETRGLVTWRSACPVRALSIFPPPPFVLQRGLVPRVGLRLWALLVQHACSCPILCSPGQHGRRANTTFRTVILHAKTNYRNGHIPHLHTN